VHYFDTTAHYMHDPAPSNPKGLLNKVQLAERLGIEARSIEKLVRSRKIPVIRLGHRTVRFSWPKVEEALNKLTVEAVK
jgi:excisionase family DNA binding protein